MAGAALSVDYGTSSTVAVLRTADDRVRPLLFDGSPMLASAVYADTDRLLTGRDAVGAARVEPSRFEPNPKRRVDDNDVLLGERVYRVADLVAATLRRVAEEARRTAGQEVAVATVLTHPVAWGATRRAVLTEACTAAGFAQSLMVPEPVAAASYYASALGVDVPVGHAVVVYDLGGGTFDACVVGRSTAGFEVLAYRGLDDAGGLDLDALVVAHAETFVRPGQRQDWHRLTTATDADARRQHRLLWDDARHAKETLSRHPAAAFHAPILNTDVLITRAEYEAAAQPLLARTVEVTTATMRESRIPTDRIAGIFLVGGASRTPLIATLLHRATGIGPTALDHPELVVAEGALHAVHRSTEAATRSGPSTIAVGVGNRRNADWPYEPALPTRQVPPATPNGPARGPVVLRGLRAAGRGTWWVIRIAMSVLLWTGAALLTLLIVGTIVFGPGKSGWGGNVGVGVLGVFLFSVVLAAVVVLIRVDVRRYRHRAARRRGHTSAGQHGGREGASDG